MVMIVTHIFHELYVTFRYITRMDKNGAMMHRLYRRWMNFEQKESIKRQRNAS